MYGLTDEELAYLAMTGQLQKWIEKMKELEKPFKDR